MNISKMADEIVEARKRQDLEEREIQASIRKDDLFQHQVRADSATCPHHFFTDGLGLCSNCGTYVGLRR